MVEMFVSFEFSRHSFCMFLFFRVIVGAPEDDSEQAKVGIEKAGAVYRCQTQMPFRCDQIPFDTSGELNHYISIMDSDKFLVSSF